MSPLASSCRLRLSFASSSFLTRESGLGLLVEFLVADLGVFEQRVVQLLVSELRCHRL